MRMSALEKAIESLEDEISVLTAAKARLLHQRNTAVKKPAKPRAVPKEEQSQRN